MVSEPSNESGVALATQPADRSERRLALAAVIVTVLVFAALAPFSGRPLPRAPLFLPIYQTALIVCDLITASLLFRQFAIAGSQAIRILAGTYLLSALMAVCHALSFPGLFSPSGLLGSGPQTTAWLYFLWHAAFPLGVIAYAQMPSESPARIGALAAIVRTIVVAAILATAITMLTTLGHDLLPEIMRGDQDLQSKMWVALLTCAITLAALPILWRRNYPRHSVLDIWLIVVICAWQCDIALAAVFNDGRYSVGWYAGRLYGLLASSFLVGVFIFEDGKLYRLLAHTLTAERDQRRLVQERTAELDALNRSLEQRVNARTAELRRSQEELRESAALGATAREQERARLARELHDELDQALALLQIELTRLEKRLAADGAAAAQFANLHAIIDRTFEATKRIASNLRPLILDDLGFAPAVRWLVESFERHHGIECNVSMDPPQFELAEPYSTTVFRIMQESLTNVARHAKATRVDVALRVADRSIDLSIRDNGVGFDPNAARKIESFGLVGLRERVTLVSGKLQIDSAQGQGTTIEVSIPLPSLADE